MHRQAGDLVIKNGIARRGLLIRHLILPSDQSDTKGIIDFVAENLGSDTYLNLMDQYHPCYRADRYPPINKNISRKEFEYYVDYAGGKGFHRPGYIFG